MSSRRSSAPPQFLSRARNSQAQLFLNPEEKQHLLDITESGEDGASSIATAPQLPQRRKAATKYAPPSTSPQPVSHREFPIEPRKIPQRRTTVHGFYASDRNVLPESPQPSPPVLRKRDARGPGSPGVQQVGAPSSPKRTVAAPPSRRERHSSSSSVSGTDSEYLNPSVQEGDNSFFESFSALQWRQENKRRQALSRAQNDAGLPPPTPESATFLRKQSSRLDAKELETLYVEVLYTIKHKVGAVAGPATEIPLFQHDLYEYAKAAFEMPGHAHVTLMNKASKEKAPTLTLNVEVIAAKDLEAKDADGFSDPYCMLGIMPSTPGKELVCSSDEDGPPLSPKFAKEKKGLKKFSLRRKKSEKNTTIKDLVPVRLVRTTSVKLNTLSPAWGEKFVFDLDDFTTDKLHLDIWDHDDEFSVVEAARKLNEIKGLKGLSRYFKQVAQSARHGKQGDVDDFLGCIDISLHDVPSFGKDKWFELEGRNGGKSKKDRGAIHLKLNLATKEEFRGLPEGDNFLDLEQHKHLLNIFIEHQIVSMKTPVHEWTGELDQAAEMILHQHAIQGDITPVQESMCRWLAFSSRYREYQFDVVILMDILNELEGSFKPGTLNWDEEERLATSFQTFMDYCMNCIQRTRELFPATINAAFKHLGKMLRTLNLLCNTALFKKVCPFQNALHTDLNTAIRKGTTEWFARMQDLTGVIADQEKVKMSSIVKLVTAINLDMMWATDFYHQVFESIVKVDYAGITYKEFDKLLIQALPERVKAELGGDLAAIVERHMQQCSCVITGEELPERPIRKSLSDDDPSESDPSLITVCLESFQLYMAVADFARKSECVEVSQRQKLQLYDWADWFRPSLTLWLLLARHKGMRRLKRAVDLDEVKRAGETVKYSTSAADGATTFNQMADFWKSLDWPLALDAFMYVRNLTQIICDGALYYGELMRSKLRSTGYYDEIGEFDVTQQLCICLNNMEHVRRSLRPLGDTLNWPAVTAALLDEQTSESALSELQGMTREAEADLIAIVGKVAGRVADKMRPGMKKDVFHLCWTPETIPADEAMGPLLRYLDSNLVTLNKHLLRTNFARVLSALWEEVLEEIWDIVDENPVASPQFFTRLGDSLDILVEFFHANQKGLSMEAITTTRYTDLRNLLRFNREDSKRLIQSFYSEKLDQQNQTTDTSQGTLSVRVYYNMAIGRLSVEVLSAKDLIPLDVNGLSDPYVIVELVPSHVFKDVENVQTKIHKNTLNPTFDESFEFEVTPEQCQESGACLIFTIMDYDMIVQNDLGGEAFFSLAAVPGVQGEEVSSVKALQGVTLPVLKASHKANGAMGVLQKRQSCKDAQEFVASRLKKEKLAPS